MLSPATVSELGEVLKRLFILPSSRIDEDVATEVWMNVLAKQPLCSIMYALDRIICDTKRTFRPLPGQFLGVVEEHAERTRNKRAALKQAIKFEMEG